MKLCNCLKDDGIKQYVAQLMLQKSILFLLYKLNDILYRFALINRLICKGVFGFMYVSERMRVDETVIEDSQCNNYNFWLIRTLWVFLTAKER